MTQSRGLEHANPSAMDTSVINSRAWVYPSIITAAVCLVLLLIIVGLLFRMDSAHLRRTKESSPNKRRKDSSASSTDEEESELPRIIHVDSSCASDGPSYDDMLSNYSGSLVRSTMEVPPTLSCPKLDHQTPSKSRRPPRSSSPIEDLLRDGEQLPGLQYTVTGYLSQNADDSSIVRDMKKAVAGLENQPSVDAVEL